MVFLDRELEVEIVPGGPMVFRAPEGSVVADGEIFMFNNNHKDPQAPVMPFYFRVEGFNVTTRTFGGKMTGCPVCPTN